VAGKRSKASKQEVRHFEKLARYIALSLVLLIVAGFGYLQFHQWLVNPATLPVKIVRIDGTLKFLHVRELEQTVADKVTVGFFNIDLQAIKQSAHQLAWVDEVRVKRIWPDTLVMSIHERVALAHWGDRHLVTASGEVFLPPAEAPAGLARLSGPEDRAMEVVSRFNREKDRFASIGLVVSRLAISDRGAWTMNFSNGLKVAIGRADVENRLQRLQRYLGMISAVRGIPESIDLRYHHGMAVAWKPDENSAENKDKGAV